MASRLVGRVEPPPVATGAATPPVAGAEPPPATVSLAGAVVPVVVDGPGFEPDPEPEPDPDPPEPVVAGGGV